ncbi:Protein N-terminal glutamine amidohydrolase [Tulasnella sp. 419]|nr:Protein N-terminal glutamine amidohydrolase [Tulasnella sp. 419]
MALKVQSGGSGRSHIDGGHGPPAVSTPYTACYCEENVYLLGEALCRMFLTSQTNSEPTPVSTSSSTSGCKIYAVIISNPTKSIAVFEQLRSSGGSDWDYLVVWDYHVILCLQLNAEIWVYDADSRLGSPCKWDRYTENTFRSGQLNNMVDQYRCIFRVVPMGEYLANFASDRSHMASRWWSRTTPGSERLLPRTANEPIPSIDKMSRYRGEQRYARKFPNRVPRTSTHLPRNRRACGKRSRHAA